jgi:hypothetical protein
MKTIRLRIAVLGCIAPSIIAMLMLTHEVDCTACGPVWGRVTYNGRPLEEGAVYFDPIEAQDNDPALGPIGKDGSYSIDPKWHRGHPEKARFRICVIPYRNTVTPGDRWRSPSEEPRPDTDPASLRDETLGAREPMLVAFPVPKRFTKIETSGLAVTLDRHSARVDVDLKD